MTADPQAGSISLWRIAAETPDFGSDDLSGKGAALCGGRWNRRGTPMVYASTSRALACLETVVHLGGGVALPLNRYLVEIQVPSGLWDARLRFDAEAQVGWDALPPGRVSIGWGSAWAEAGGACLAEVPSAIVPEEWNVLINPRHPDAVQLRAIRRRRWLYDPRSVGAT